MTKNANVSAVYLDETKQQDGTALPLLDHDFTGYEITNRYQWEVNIQIPAKRTNAMAPAN
eukprot:6967412-Ditylum_brightwellii.AAC.1